MYIVIDSQALPVKIDGDGLTWDQAIEQVNKSIWNAFVVYVDEYTEPRRLMVRWFQGKLYCHDIMLDQRYCFNTYKEASEFKEDFHIKIRELWRSMR